MTFEASAGRKIGHQRARADGAPRKGLGLDSIRLDSGGTLESTVGAGPPISSMVAALGLSNECRRRSCCCSMSCSICCSRRRCWRSLRLRRVVIPALSPTRGTRRRHLPMTLVSRSHDSIREDCVMFSVLCSRSRSTLPGDARSASFAGSKRHSSAPAANRVKPTLSDRSRAVATGTPHVRFGCRCGRISQRHQSHAATAD